LSADGVQAVCIVIACRIGYEVAAATATATATTTTIDCLCMRFTSIFGSASDGSNEIHYQTESFI